MNRDNTMESYESIVQKIRSACPSIAITTDVLVGFPGETEEDFTETLDFIRRNNFSGGHVFTFSERTGTGARLLPNPVTDSVKSERNAIVRKTLKQLAGEYQQQFIGKILPVLWESSNEIDDSHFRLTGWTDNYIRVVTIADQNRHNQIDSVRLVEKDIDAWKAQIQ